MHTLQMQCPVFLCGVHCWGVTSSVSVLINGRQAWAWLPINIFLTMFFVQCAVLVFVSFVSKGGGRV
jgi:hypothetical protein